MTLPDDPWERETYYLKGNNMKQHTKEPWEVQSPGVDQRFYIIAPADTFLWLEQQCPNHIAMLSELYDGDTSKKQNRAVFEANAQRIVACVNNCAGINPEAVPDLLGACKSALRALLDNLDPGPMDADAVKGLAAAISKAKP